MTAPADWYAICDAARVLPDHDGRWTADAIVERAARFGVVLDPTVVEAARVADVARLDAAPRRTLTFGLG
jgi:hypothetical protein